MAVQFSKCYGCQHFLSGGQLENFTCKAYPKGIPADIVLGRTNHDRPLEGDNGYQYRNIFDEPAESREE